MGSSDHALRYGLLTTGLVLAVSAVLAVVAGTALAAVSQKLEAATARTIGTVSAVHGDRVEVRWTPAGGAHRTDEIELGGSPPAVGVQAEVAYDPSAPGEPLVPGAAVLATADRSFGVLCLAATVIGLVLVIGCWQVVSRRRAATRPIREIAVRRVRIQNGVLARTWLETQTVPRRWIPVHFDPRLVTLPSPATVGVHGDPARDRLVAVTVDGRRLYPSGPVTSREPLGRRTDNATAPDAATIDRAARLTGLRSHARAALPLMVPAPFVGLLWTFVDGGGVGTWLAVTALAAVLGPWVAALRGHDPS